MEVTTEKTPWSTPVIKKISIQMTLGGSGTAPDGGIPTAA